MPQKNDDFFDEQKEGSLIKATIVAKYLYVWAKVLIGEIKRKPFLAERVAYVDLFAGQGRYSDGEESTPLLILQRAIAQEDLQQYLHLVFNEKNKDFYDRLKHEVTTYAGYNSLRFKPFFMNENVQDNQRIISLFKAPKRPPMLVFADPWGYNGLSIELFASILKNWGCEVIFFFNYKRINMALNNPVFKVNMNTLFGTNKARALTEELSLMSTSFIGRTRSKARSMAREKRIITAVQESLLEALYPKPVYTIDYRFRDNNGTRTTHHLIFATTNKMGLAKMKEVMAAESTSSQQTVSMFEYNPQDNVPKHQPMLLEIDRPLDKLCDILLEFYSEKVLPMKSVYYEHVHIGKYIEKNYKDAILMLERQGRITCNPPAPQRPKRQGIVTLAEHVEVIFPKFAGREHP